MNLSLSLLRMHLLRAAALLLLWLAQWALVFPKWLLLSLWANQNTLNMKKRFSRSSIALVNGIDRDTEAFDGVSAVFAMPKSTDEEKAARKEAMQKALKEATLVPYSIMELCLESLTVVEMGLGCTNTNAASDLGVASLNLKSAAQGAWLNVLINLGGIRDEAFVNEYRTKGEEILQKALPLADKIYNEILQSL